MCSVRHLRTAAPARQRGQALAFALIFLAVGAVALYVAFNASQLTTAKSKLQNTADAAAYSVAVMQARDYNFAAYTNRAMVANQVHVAQLLSLKSWIEEVDETDGKDHVTDELVNIFADLGAVQWTLPKQVARPIIAPLKATVNSVAPTAVKGLDVLIEGLSLAQQAYTVATKLNMPFVAEEVAQANQRDTHADKGYLATLGAPRIAAWQKFTTRTDPQATGAKGAGGTGDRFADVVTDDASMDGFTPERGNIRTPFVASTAYKGCTGASVTFMLVGQPHSGATQLRPDMKGWEALDATAAEGFISCLFLPEPVPLIIPIIESMGRGGAANGPGNRYSGTSGYRGTGHIGDAIASAAAVAAGMQYSAGPGTSLDNSSRAGLQQYYDLSTPANATPAKGADFNRAPTLTLQVSRNIASTRTTSTLRVGVGRVGLQEGAPSSELRALASASAYFIRPRNSSGAGALLRAASWNRSDNRYEYPSLFNPYWQASLVDTPTVELEAAAAAQAAGAP